MTDARRVVLVVEDDDDEFLRTSQALREARVTGQVRRVPDGEQLLAYLRDRAGARTGDRPRPALILLGLDMSGKDGRAALREVKHDPGLRSIPVLVLTASGAPGVVRLAYRLGANSLLRKPASYRALVAALDVAGRYWFEVVQLPRQEGA